MAWLCARGGNTYYDIEKADAVMRVARDTNDGKEKWRPAEEGEDGAVVVFFGHDEEALWLIKPEDAEVAMRWCRMHSESW